MNRRQALTALAGVGLTGGSLWIARNGVPGPESVSSVGTKSASTTADSGSDASLPLSVETLDAPGSSAGEALVPTPNTVTVVDLFATWCAPCDEQVAELRAIHDEYESVSFVSVTNERPSDTLTREDIAAWWEENDGAWTLGIDPGSDLLRAFGATGLPYIAITNERGEVVTDHSGLATADTLRSEIDAVVK